MAASIVSNGRWFTFFQPRPEARLRLFCFPYAGGASLVFRSWQDLLQQEVEVCGAQLPGRWLRYAEPPFTRIEPLVKSVSTAIAPLCDRPFAFFGHSMGALIAFETARALRALGAPLPGHIFISGRRAPHVPDIDPPSHDLPRDELISELRRLNGTPSEILDDLDLMNLLLPVVRADLSVCETYQYIAGPPLECPITAFGGLQDAEVEGERLDAWREHTACSFRRQDMPGDHFYLHSQEALLVSTIRGELVKLLLHL